MKINKKLLIFILIALVIAAYIFFNSLWNVEDSTQQSNVWVNLILKILGKDESFAKAHHLSHYVRKAAHLLEYTILGISLGFIAKQLESLFKRKFISAPILCGMIISIIDESLQGLSDRSCEVKDVIIDSSGIVVGVLIITLLIPFIKYCIAKRKGKVK